MANMIYGHTPPFNHVDQDNISLNEANMEAKRQFKDVLKMTTSQEDFKAKCAAVHDAVNRPSHYSFGTIECIEYIKDVLTKEEFIGYLRGNMIKYQHRLRSKVNPAEDAAKMKWYNDRLIKELSE
jgi:hypothetical protein